MAAIDTAKRHLIQVATLPARAVEPLMVWLQKVLGIDRLPWVFLLPNMVIIALFSLLPVIINVVYSVTGSDNQLARGNSVGHVDRGAVDEERARTRRSDQSGSIGVDDV